MHQTWWLYDLTVLAVLILCIWGDCRLLESDRDGGRAG